MADGDCINKSLSKFVLFGFLEFFLVSLLKTSGWGLEHGLGVMVIEFLDCGVGLSEAGIVFGANHHTLNFILLTQSMTAFQYDRINFTACQDIRRKDTGHIIVFQPVHGEIDTDTQ